MSTPSSTRGVGALIPTLDDADSRGGYLRKVATFTEGFDRHRDGTDGLADALGFYRDKDREHAERPSKAFYDSDHVFQTICDWQAEAVRNGEKRPSIPKCCNRYIDEFLPSNADPKTVRSHYYTGRKRFWAQAETEMALNKWMSERE